MKNRKTQRGAGFVEYLLVSSIVTVSCLLVLSSFGQTLFCSLATSSQKMSGEEEPLPAFEGANDGCDYGLGESAT